MYAVIFLVYVNNLECYICCSPKDKVADNLFIIAHIWQCKFYFFSPLIFKYTLKLRLIALAKIVDEELTLDDEKGKNSFSRKELFAKQELSEWRKKNQEPTFQPPGRDS